MNTYYQNSKEQKSAENIRSQYVDKKDSKIDQLRSLDSKVKTPGTIIALILGIIGALLLGTGMASISVWGNMTNALLFGIPGLVLILLAYPVYHGITNSRKKSYSSQIMQLSSEIIEN